MPSTGSPCSCLTMLCSAASQVALAVKNLPANVRDAKRLRFDPWLGKIPWGRKWQPTPVFLPGKFHRQRSLAGYSPWGHRESDTTEQLSRPQEMSSQLCQSAFFSLLWTSSVKLWIPMSFNKRILADSEKQVSWGKAGRLRALVGRSPSILWAVWVRTCLALLLDPLPPYRGPV